jgi:outer membrane receptor for monomeric catechols
MLNKADNHGAQIDKQGGVAPSFRWGIGTSDEFLVSLYHLDNRNGINYGMPWLQNQMIPVDPKAYYGLDSDVSLGTAQHGTLRLRASLCRPQRVAYHPACWVPTHAINAPVPSASHRPRHSPALWL